MFRRTDSSKKNVCTRNKYSLALRENNLNVFDELTFQTILDYDSKVNFSSCSFHGYLSSFLLPMSTVVYSKYYFKVQCMQLHSQSNLLIDRTDMCISKQCTGNQLMTRVKAILPRKMQKYLSL